MANRSPIIRHQIADYLDVGKSGASDLQLCGTGFTSLDESPSSKSDSTTYINESSSSSAITGYEGQFPFETDFVKSQEVIQYIYNIGAKQLTGEDAETDYYRVDLFNKNEDGSYFARKFHVNVEVSDIKGDGGEKVTMSGNLNQVGDVVLGKATIKDGKMTFTPDSATTTSTGIGA